MREQRQLAASAELDLLSLSSLIPFNADQPSSFREFHVDQGIREIYREHERPWFELNISEVVADKLSERNPDSECLCWKIIVYSQMNDSRGENMSHRSKVTHFAAVYVPHHHETRHLMSPMKNKVSAPSLGIINMDADYNSKLFVKQNDSGVHLPSTLYTQLHGHLLGHVSPPIPSIFWLKKIIS